MDEMDEMDDVPETGADRSVEIRRAEGRYELFVDGELASFVELQRRGDVVVMPHTFTMPSFRGAGHAEQLVRSALDDLLADGARIVPSCWFVADVVRADQRYRPLVADD